MEKYIIAVDKDGTLLNSENKISEREQNVLQRLIDDGHYVGKVITGRTRERSLRSFLCSKEMGNRGNAVLSGITIK